MEKSDFMHDGYHSVIDYGYSKQMSENDHRHDQWKFQRETRGFDDTELWNLDVTIAKFILPRLIAFRESVCEEESETVWDKMIFAFDFVINGRFDREGMIKVNEGLDLFRKHYLGLWS